MWPWVLNGRYNVKLYVNVYKLCWVSPEFFKGTHNVSVTCYNSLTCLRSTRSCNINLTRESIFFASITWLTLLKYFSIRFCTKKRTLWISCLLCHTQGYIPFLCRGPFPSQWWTSVWQSTPETFHLKMTSAVSKYTCAWWLQKVATEERGREGWGKKDEDSMLEEMGLGECRAWDKILNIWENQTSVLLLIPWA